MSGFAAFAGKEAREILRTWRIWVLPGILLFFALTGPVLAKLTPQLVGALAGDQLKGLVIPTPTYHDAYTQWIKNLSQIALFALIIIYASSLPNARAGRQFWCSPNRYRAPRSSSPRRSFTRHSSRSWWLPEP